MSSSAGGGALGEPDVWVSAQLVMNLAALAMLSRPVSDWLG